MLVRSYIKLVNHFRRVETGTCLLWSIYWVEVLGGNVCAMRDTTKARVQWIWPELTKLEGCYCITRSGFACCV